MALAVPQWGRCDGSANPLNTLCAPQPLRVHHRLFHSGPLPVCCSPRVPLWAGPQCPGVFGGHPLGVGRGWSSELCAQPHTPPQLHRCLRILDRPFPDTRNQDTHVRPSSWASAAHLSSKGHTPGSLGNLGTWMPPPRPAAGGSPKLSGLLGDQRAQKRCHLRGQGLTCPRCRLRCPRPGRELSPLGKPSHAG